LAIRENKEFQPRMDTDEPNAAIAATTDFGLRRESRLAHPRQPKLYESGGVFLFS
jgi:hypothetical protein